MIINTIKTSDCTPQTIVIGRRTTYDTLQVVFDLSYLAETYGSGAAVLVVKRSQDTTAYPATITQEGNTLTWTVSETDTYYVGTGECELMWYVNNGLAKTIIYPVVVMRDILQTTEEPPDAYENWVESLTALGAETQQNALNAAQSATEAETAKGKAENAQTAAEEAATKAEEASAHAPIIVNGYWYAWDATTEAYQNTGVKAEGQDGTDGVSPVITVTDITGGHRVTITDANGTKTVDVMNGTDGTDGTDGFSPTVTVTTITGGHRVTITDKNGAHSFDVMDGQDGASDAGEVTYDDTATYPSGSVGAALTNQKNAISDIAEHKTPVNLYNKNSQLNIDNYKQSASGAYSALNGSSVSHPIPIELGKTYSFKFSAGYYGVTANQIVRFCDADGNLIITPPIGKNTSLNATPSQDNSYGTFTVTEATDYPYCTVNVRMSDKNVMIFAEGEMLPSYSEWFEPYWMIRESALPDDMPLPANAQNNLLYGKKAAFVGDSICYGAGFSGGYPVIIGANNGMSISNTGQTGATLATGTTVDGVNRGWISQKVANMPADYDYYIVEGGVNDASLGVQLGTITSGYTATFDTTTICGAMEQICKTLQTTFAGKKYGFLFPHNVYGETNPWNTGWRDTMKQCLKKWGIPYLDLSDECAQLRNIDALRVYTSGGDGWHPTEDGYKLYYVPKIEAWMKTL